MRHRQSGSEWSRGRDGARAGGYAEHALPGRMLPPPRQMRAGAPTAPWRGRAAQAGRVGSIGPRERSRRAARAPRHRTRRTGRPRASVRSAPRPAPRHRPALHRRRDRRWRRTSPATTVSQPERVPCELLSPVQRAGAQPRQARWQRHVRAPRVPGVAPPPSRPRRVHGRRKPGPRAETASTSKEAVLSDAAVLAEAVAGGVRAATPTAAVAAAAAVPAAVAAAGWQWGSEEG